MKRIALVLVLLCLPIIVFAQTSGKLSGTVTSDGQPLVGANVLVKGTSFGGATDENGRYYILDISVGAYEVEVQYIGYKTMTISNVRVNSNLTTELNFSLEVAAVEGETIQVTAERPLIQQNATNTTAIIDKEVVQSLPVRDVSDVIALQAGAVGGNVRGGRDNDNAYYIDGVLMKNRWSGDNLENSLSQQSMTEISFQAGGLSAEYGGANGGVVNIATASGSNRFSGSAEYLTDLGSSTPGTDKNGLYSYGKQLYNFSVGGPLTSNIRFYALLEQEKNSDNSPSFTPAPFMDRQILDRSQWLSMGYDTLYTWEDGDYAEGIIHYEEFIRDNQTNPDSLMADVTANDTTYVLGSNYRRLYGAKRMGSDDRMTYQANLDMDFRPFRVKVGLGGYNYDSDPYVHRDHLLNWDNSGYDYNAASQYLYANATWSISSKSYLKAILSSNKYEQYHFNGMSAHGTEDDATSSNFADYGIRSTDFGSENYYLRRSGRNPIPMPDLVGFYNYGDRYDDYQQRFLSTNGVRVDYVNQIGSHEIKAGMELYNTTTKWYRIAQPFEIAEKSAIMDADFDGIVTVDEVGDQNGDGQVTNADLDFWNFITYRNAYVDNLGYNIFGQSSDSYGFDDHSSAPGESGESRFYIQDKIELKDVVVQVGLAYETFNPNTEAPDSDGDGVGDAEGFRNIHLKDGRIDKSGTQTNSGTWVDNAYKWESVGKHTALLPRLGFSFPVTDQTSFHANYGVYMQAPPLQYIYLTESSLTANLTQGNMTVSENPTLRPEKSTQYEVGIHQMIGQVAAFELTGYYKEVRDYIMMITHQEIDGNSPLKNGSTASWTQYQNGDYGITQGISASLHMRRVKGVLAQMNYTYMTARGTGSDADNNFIISWLGGNYPTSINRLSYDQRHTGSLVLDYRNPMGFGVNAVYTVGSGTAYTPATVQSVVFGRGWDQPTAAINSGDKPWTARLDLRADYNLKLAGTNVNAYVTVQNAFNRENVFSVYEGSGQVSDDAWLETAEGKSWVKSQNANFPAAGSNAENLYIDRLSSPSRWGLPRIIRFGLQVNI